MTSLLLSTLTIIISSIAIGISYCTIQQERDRSKTLDRIEREMDEERKAKRRRS